MYHQHQLVNQHFHLDAEIGFNSPSSPSAAKIFGYYGGNGNSMIVVGDGTSQSYGSAIAVNNIIGVALDAGAIHDVVPTTSVLSLDTSDCAAGAGDRFGVVCDGTNYYVEDATALTTGAFNVADNAV